MNGLIDTNGVSESHRREDPKDLKLVEILIDKIIKRLEDNSFQPRVQDALKAIQLKQKLVKTSEAEKTFWQEIDDIRTSELQRLENLESKTEDLQAQILRTIMRLKYEVKNGLLPVKTITDAHNQGKPRGRQFTYQRIGRLLTTMGFQKGKAGNNSAILWNEEKIECWTLSHPLPTGAVSQCSGAIHRTQYVMSDKSDRYGMWYGQSRNTIMTQSDPGGGQVKNPATGGVGNFFVGINTRKARNTRNAACRPRRC